VLARKFFNLQGHACFVNAKCAPFESLNNLQLLENMLPYFGNFRVLSEKSVILPACSTCEGLRLSTVERTAVCQKREINAACFEPLHRVLIDVCHAQAAILASSVWRGFPAFWLHRSRLRSALHAPARFDHLSLTLDECRNKGTTASDTGEDAPLQPCLINRECFPIAKGNGSLITFCSREFPRPAYA